MTKSERQNPKRRMQVHYTSKTCEWATPDSLFQQVADEFGPFDLDACATAENAKAARYFTKSDNGLLKDWTGTVWMNPPYGREIGKWVRKAFDAAKAGARVICLLPARTDTAWWHDFVMHGTVRFIRGRLKFGGAVTSAPFPSALVIFQ